MQDVGFGHAILLTDILEARRCAVVAVADNHLVLDDKCSHLAALAVTVLAPYPSHAEVAEVEGTLLVGGDAVSLQECLDVGLLAAEVHIEPHGVGSTALRKDFTAEATSRLFVEDTLFEEETEGIGIQNLSPFIAVVTRRISAAHDMRELYAHICIWDSRQQLGAAPSLTFEVQYVLGEWFRQRVIGHIEHAEAELPDAGITAMEVAALADALDEFVGQRLSCLVVIGKGMQKLGLNGEVLHQLRRKFHEVAQDIRATLSFVMHLREDAM